jgi:hypothetical protein
LRVDLGQGERIYGEPSHLILKQPLVKLRLRMREAYSNPGEEFDRIRLLHGGTPGAWKRRVRGFLPVNWLK